MEGPTPEIFFFQAIAAFTAKPHFHSSFVGISSNTALDEGPSLCSSTIMLRRARRLLRDATSCPEPMVIRMLYSQVPRIDQKHTNLFMSFLVLSHPVQIWGNWAQECLVAQRVLEFSRGGQHCWSPAAWAVGSFSISVSYLQHLCLSNLLGGNPLYLFLFSHPFDCGGRS